MHSHSLRPQSPSLRRRGTVRPSEATRSRVPASPTTTSGHVPRRLPIKVASFRRRFGVGHAPTRLSSLQNGRLSLCSLDKSYLASAPCINVPSSHSHTTLNS